MAARGILWVIGGYLLGTFPSTLVVARVRHAQDVIDAARRDAGEADAHMLIAARLGARWTAVAAFADVLKGFVSVLAARHLGGVSEGWLASMGVASVLGHTYPLYAPRMAGRGLAAASGVLLLLLPVEMAVAGSLIVVGGLLRRTSLFSTVGMASVPLVGAAREQPVAFVVMAILLVGIVAARRLEGLGALVRSGVPVGTALYWRVVHDSSTRPGRSGGISLPFGPGSRTRERGQPGR